MRLVHRSIAAVVILSADDKILMGQKNPDRGGVWADAWHIPGGGIETDETAEAAAVREVCEETGVTLTEENLTPLDSLGSMTTTKTDPQTHEEYQVEMVFTVFLARLTQLSKNIELCPCDDLKILQWFGADQLETVKLTPPSTELFKRVKMSTLMSKRSEGDKL